MVDMGDYNYDDEWESMYDTNYISPDGDWHLYYNEAFNATLGWLKSEYKEEENVI